MVWFLGIVTVLVLGAAVVVAAGRGGQLRPVYEDRPDALVSSDAALTGADVRRVRFSVGFRGYRTDEVDTLLARLAEQLDDRQPPRQPDGQPAGGQPDGAWPSDGHDEEERTP